MGEKLKTNAVIYGILILALLAALIFGIYKDMEAKEYASEIKMDYQRCFTELVQYVDDLEMNLEKSRFVNDPGQMMRLSGEIYREAMSASANLAMLPLKAEPLEHLSEFLNQVGNYAYSLSYKMLEGEEITSDEYDNLAGLCRYAEMLATGLDGNLEQLYNGTLDIRRVAENNAAGDIDNAMGELETQLHDYPALIYDGPFSSHLTDRKPLLLEGKSEITAEEAIVQAKSIAGGEFQCVEENGNIPAFYLYDNSGAVSMAITKQGGYLLSYLNDREIGEPIGDIGDGKLAAALFLQSIGFENMKESYYETVNNVAVINYAATQEGYTIYPDLIKVKVALDTLSVVGFESRGYVMYHKEREVPSVKVSAEAAADKINPNVEILSSALAVIPTQSGGEAFAWQIEGKIDDRRCLIYVNTQTGAEEKIFLLIESETGVLAV